MFPRLVTLLVALLPLLILPTKAASSTVFYLLLLLGIYCWLTMRPGTSRPAATLRGYRALCVTFALPPLSVLATSAFHGQFNSADMEKALRVTLALPILLLFLRVPPRWLRHVQWGLIGGALVGAAMVIFVMQVRGLDRGQLAAYGTQYNAVTFTNLLTLFGLSALLCLGWSLSAFPKLEAGLKVLAASAALYATLISATRSSWMAIPGFVLIAITVYTQLSLRWRITGFVALVVLLIGLASLSPILCGRLQDAHQDLTQFFNHTSPDTSLGIRLQLWHAALVMFLQSPLLGVGGGMDFSLALQALQSSHVVSPYVAANFGEPHNDYLLALAGYGLVGFLSFAAVYLVPAWYFCQRLRHVQPQSARIAAAVGLLFCVSFMVFSLSELMFRGMRTVPIYSVMIMLFLALSTPTHKPVSAPTSV